MIDWDKPLRTKRDKTKVVITEVYPDNIFSRRGNIGESTEQNAWKENGNYFNDYHYHPLDLENYEPEEK